MVVSLYPQNLTRYNQRIQKALEVEQEMLQWTNIQFYLLCNPFLILKMSTYLLLIQYLMRWRILSKTIFKCKGSEFLTLSEFLIKYWILIVVPIASRYSIFCKLTLSNKLWKIEDDYINLLRTLQQCCISISYNFRFKKTNLPWLRQRYQDIFQEVFCN